MKKTLIALICALALLGLPLMALASVITSALYSGTIVISNNGTTTENVSTNFTLNTQGMIDAGYINSSVNDTSIQNNSGVDVAFMPSIAGNPWIVFVPSIGANSSVNYQLYAGNVTGGKVRYFPDASGMRVTDNILLEGGDNFSITISGFFNTNVASHNITLTAGLLNQLGLGVWNAAQLVDGNNTTSGFNTDASGIGSYVRIDLGASNATALTQWRMYAGGANVNAVWDIQRSDNTTSWDTVYSGLNMDGAAGWHSANWTASLPARYWQAYKTDAASGGDNTNELEVYTAEGPFVSKTGAFYIYPESDNITARIVGTSVNVTSAIPAGEHSIIVDTNVDTNRVVLYVDGIESANNSLMGRTMPDTAGDWLFSRGGAMPYTANISMSVNGTQRGFWSWEYATTFTDQSGNGNTATPSFRTTSSDTDVSANLTSFQPVEEAQAPPFSLGAATAFLTAPTLSSNFTTNITPTYPGATVISDIASVAATPAQLPFTILAGMGIIAVSLFISYLLRYYGSGSLLIKIFVIIALMGIAIAVHVVDFWMLLFFVILAVAILFGSKQESEI